MHVSIDLKGQLKLATEEVENESPIGELALEFEAEKAVRPHDLPDLPLRGRGIPPTLLRQLSELISSQSPSSFNPLIDPSSEKRISRLHGATPPPLI